MFKWILRVYEILFGEWGVDGGEWIVENVLQERMTLGEEWEEGKQDDSKWGDDKREDDYKQDNYKR